MAGEQNKDDQAKDDTGLNPIEEARRIAEGKSLAEAQAEKAADMAELPDIMRRLGEGIRDHTKLIEERNDSESDRLTNEYSQPLQKAEERLDAALSQTTENPTEDIKRAWAEFEGVRDRVREGVIMKLLVLSELSPSSDEQPAVGLAGNDLIPPLFLAKMTPVLNRRDFHGAREENAQGQVMYEALKKPRVVPEAELQRLTKQTLIGWFQFNAGLAGLEEPLRYSKAFANQIVERANKLNPK